VPKLEPKDIQKELEKGDIWPVYWIFGPEQMKIRELVKRIRGAVLGETTVDAATFNEEHLDGSDIDAADVLHGAESLGFNFGGESAAALRLVIVREAHALKNQEILLPLLQPRSKRSELTSVVIFIAKDLDQRKKFSKALVENAAVIECSAVSESDREPWIQYLAKKRAMTVDQPLAIHLLTLEPWSLDSVDQELEKRFLLSHGTDGAIEGEWNGQVGTIQEARFQLQSLSDRFLNSFFGRKSAICLGLADEIASQPQEAIPLLGLLAWNVRQLLVLAQAHAEKKSPPNLKVPPFVQTRLKAWAEHWSVEDLISLQRQLSQIDFQTKQTPLHPLGMWSHLIQVNTQVSGASRN